MRSPDKGSPLQVPTSLPPGPSGPSAPLSDLAASLGVSSWPYTDAALVEALKAKAEQERTKQEYYRLESNQRVVDVLERAQNLGIFGSAVLSLFGPNDEAAKARINASQLTYLQPPFRGSSQTSPQTPGNLESPFLPPSYSGPRRSENDQNWTPDRGHRSVASSIPAFSLPPLRQPGAPPGAPAQPAQPTQPAQPSQPAQPAQPAQPRSYVPGPYYPTQLVAPQFSPLPPMTVGQQQSPIPSLLASRSVPGSEQHSPVQSISPHQPLVPVMRTMSAKSARNRGHQHSLSTGSDLQIHQWKPRQLHRDNRWKYPNPMSKVTKRSTPQHTRQESQPTWQPIHRAADSMATEQSFDSSVSDQSITAQPPAQLGAPLQEPGLQSDTSVNSAAVVAAAQNSRRKNAHTRRRSAMSVDYEDLRRRDEGVAALTSLADGARNGTESGPGPIQRRSSESPVKPSANSPEPKRKSSPKTD